MFLKKCLTLLTALALLVSLVLPGFAQNEIAFAKKSVQIPRYLTEAKPVAASLRTSNQQAVYDAVYRCLRDASARIDFENTPVPKAEFENIVYQVMLDHLELFYFSGGYSYYYYESYGNVYVVGFEPEYLTFDVSIPEAKKIFSRETSKILSLVDRKWSDEKKVLFLHDYIAVNFQYDLSYTIYDVYNFLTKKTGVCQAYTDLYTYLLRNLGIEVDAVVSEGMNHTWNVVKINGNWYHVDITWDDPVTAEDGHYYGLAYHDNFLVSDAGIAATEHYGWYGLQGNYTCSDRSYETAFWADSNSPAAFCDGSWYVLKQGGIYREGSANPVLPLNMAWPVYGKPGYAYNAYYSGLDSEGGLLFFNTPDEIKSFNPKTGSISTLLTTHSDRKFYGITMEDTVISYITELKPGVVSGIRSFVPALPMMLGDVNGNIEVTSADAVMMSRHLASWALPSFNKTAADINGDGKVNTTDSVLLKRWLAKWDIPYAVGEFVA